MIRILRKALSVVCKLVLVLLIVLLLLIFGASPAY